MDGVVRAEYKYGSLHLKCDSHTVRRIHALIRAELAVDTPIPDGEIDRGVCVHEDMPHSAPRRNWLSIVSGMVGAAMSGVVHIAGLVTIVRWIVQ